MTSPRALCTTIEPVYRMAMCQRDLNHSGQHRAVMGLVDGGIETMEWSDTWRIRQQLGGPTTARRESVQS